MSIFRRLGLGALLLAAAMPACERTASAQDSSGLDASTVTIDKPWVAIITGLLLPLVVGLVTKLNASNTVKVAVGIVVAGLAAVITEAIQDDGSAVLGWDTLETFVMVYGTQLLTYLGIWRPLSLNARTAPGTGLG